MRDYFCCYATSQQLYEGVRRYLCTGQFDFPVISSQVHFNIITTFQINYSFLPPKPGYLPGFFNRVASFIR